jgi:hypothetical protein
MSITLIAVFAVLFSFPGYIFIRSYYSASFSIKFTKIDLYHELIYSLFPSLIIHSIAIWLTKKFGYPLNIHEVFINYCQSLINVLANISLRGFVFYNIWVWVLSFFAGNICRIIIKNLGCDIIFESLRYPNSYYYLLSGEIRDIEYINRRKGFERMNVMLPSVRPSRKIGLKVIDVLVKVNGSLILYRGILNHYTLAADNKLDKIFLIVASKSNFLNDSTEDHIFKKIPGAHFVIDGNDIININMSYFNYNITKEEPLP